MKRIDLTKYPNKSVKQLLNNNNEIRKMLPIKTDLEIKDFINLKYVLTDEQLNYFISKI